jgi:methylenetetrahydrofolate dehydrogenase (NADP+)/methenyltetrahydrofolate cyclohydrolase
MKILDGSELAGYVKERQARQVRNLRQSWNVFPHLAIVQVGENPVSDVYVRLKKAYGEDILVDVSIHRPTPDDVMMKIENLNNDDTVHAIVVQLPLPSPLSADVVLETINPEKDIDGLGPHARYVSATATAIDWLLAGYNVDVKSKKIAIVGQGKLVGEPLTKLWKNAGYQVTGYDDTVDDLARELRGAQIIVSAAGQPGLITADMIQPGAVVVDAGVTSDNGSLVGDVDASVRERGDITITPEKGGVGPLTVAALFDNVIQAARASVKD